MTSYAKAICSIHSISIILTKYLYLLASYYNNFSPYKTPHATHSALWTTSLWHLVIYITVNYLCSFIILAQYQNYGFRHLYGNTQVTLMNSLLHTMTKLKFADHIYLVTWHQSMASIIRHIRASMMFTYIYIHIVHIATNLSTMSSSIKPYTAI